MKFCLLAFSLVLVGGSALAQSATEGSRRSRDQLRQERSRSLPPVGLQSRDERELNQLLRLRERGLERSKRLRQQGQASRPANGNNSPNNSVVTQ